MALEINESTTQSGEHIVYVGEPATHNGYPTTDIGKVVLEFLEAKAGRPLVFPAGGEAGDAVNAVFDGGQNHASHSVPIVGVNARIVFETTDIT